MVKGLEPLLIWGMIPLLYQLSYTTSKKIVVDKVKKPLL